MCTGDILQHNTAQPVGPDAPAGEGASLETVIDVAQSVQGAVVAFVTSRAREHEGSGARAIPGDHIGLDGTTAKDDLIFPAEAQIRHARHLVIGRAFIVGADGAQSSDAQIPGRNVDVVFHARRVVQGLGCQ